MKGGGIHATDHAILRWLERVHDVPVDLIRKHLESSKCISTAAAMKCDTVVMAECRLKLEGTTIVTVLPKRLSKKPRDKRRGGE